MRIHFENYYAGGRDFEIAGFREFGNIMVKIFELVDGRAVLVKQMEAEIVSNPEEDDKIFENEEYRQVVAGAKHFLIIATSGDLNKPDEPLFQNNHNL